MWSPNEGFVLAVGVAKCPNRSKEKVFAIVSPGLGQTLIFEFTLKELNTECDGSKDAT